MIATIRGTVSHVFESTLVVEVFGIGYAVRIPARVLSMFTVGAEIFLYTYQYVREDALELFGFHEHGDQIMFERLLLVSGIGPKLALVILSHYTAQQIHEAIVNQDVALLQSVSGVGKKTAQRVIVELQEQIADIVLGASHTQQVGLKEALEALGYSQAESLQAARTVDTSLPLEEQVKRALQAMH